MYRKLLIAVVLGGWLLFGFSHVPPVRPNVLLILADDLRADALGCYGNPYIHTPHIDQLAKEGLRFTNAYILGGHHGAICAPSRAMLLTGKSFFRIGDKMNGQTTIPELLRQYGYQTFLTGKWHNEKETVVRAFEQARNVMFGGMNDHFKTAMQDLKADGTFTEKIEKGFSTDVFCESALEFLDNHDPHKPFFAYVPFTAPHDPRSPLPQYAALYNEKSMPLPPNFMPLHPFSFGNEMAIRDEFLAAYPRTVEVIRGQTADYYGLITHLDAVIGKIIKKLKDKGLYENTVIVFAADNGLALGSHGLLGKQNLYEHSMRVPLIVSGGGVPANQTRSAFVYLLDLFPTFCDLLKIPTPSGLDGKSLLPVVSRANAMVRSEIFTGYMTIQRAIRDARYKLIRYPKIDHTVLYDLQRDPYELNDIAQKPEYQLKVTQLMAKMAQKQAEFGDKAPLSAPPFATMTWDYRALKREPDQWQPPYVLEKYFKTNDPR